jgi:transglutaminase-like putative cysteine protease
MKKSTSEMVEQLIFYAVIFLILREWLIPIIELTDTGYLTLFMLFIALCLLLGLFKLQLYITWPIKIAYITWVSVYIYNDGALTTRQFLSDELTYNLDVLLAGDWILVSDPFRTSLFFLLIWMLIYLIQHWVTVRLTIYYFLVLTVFFIATLDTFTAYDGTMAIIKVMILGLVMTSVLFIKRLMQETNMQKDWRSYFKFALPIIVLVTIVGFVAGLLPKAEPQWPDPVPYIKGVAGVGGSNSSISTVGYGNNDENLGGPFVGDDTVVFEIQTPIRQYWRVETKDYYTTKGWVQFESTNASDIFPAYNDIPLSITPGSGERQSVEIRSLINHPFLLQAYGTTNYQLNNPESFIKLNKNSEKLNVFLNGEDVSQEVYALTFKEPLFSFTELKTMTTSVSNDPRYLQLPDELPQRVRDLAHEITDLYGSVYDKARAIEDYFRRGGFAYETQNVMKPDADEDYVDQFLFETKLGYCDNFSTSMAVLLRAVGIQARWVKGFSSGERITSFNGIHTYEVTNNDAHSWVEAYIDGIGWVPFEPTIGFSNPVNIDYDMELDSGEEQVPNAEDLEKPEEDELNTQANTPVETGITFNFSKYKWVLYSLGVVLLIVAFVLWKLRGKWQPKLVVQMNRSKLKNAETFEDSYFVLLKQLERIGLKRRQDETLKLFATRVDQRLDTTKMSELTAVYEEVIYADISENFNKLEVREIWEYLINRTSG